MNKLEILNNLTRSFYKVGFKFKKHSPEILIVAGAMGVVTSTVMACKATTKINPIIEDHKKKLDCVQYIAENPETMPELADPKANKKARAAVYAETSVELVKLYGPSVFLGVTSLGLMMASNGIMRRRYGALAAAYTIVDNNFKAYRKRVVDRFGEELDKELRYNVRTEEVEETVVDEKGKQKKVKKKVQVSDHDPYSDYARCFDESCIGWTKDPEKNLTFLNLQQNVANERLQRRGYLFLNEVYEMLGFQRTAPGQAVGWYYDPDNKHPEYQGDSFVDFNIFDKAMRNSNFVNGYERSVWLDFNVAQILHLI